MKREIHIIDATNKSLGRLATQIVALLRGKNKPNFVPYLDMGDTVIVKNIEKMKFTGNKLKTKKYFRFTGYLGNLKEATLKEMLEKKGPAEVLKIAVKGMLPKNRLREKQIKRLHFK